MEQFNAMPFPQKIGVLVGMMAMVAGLFYYAMIMPEDDLAAQAESQKLQAQSEIDKLNKEVTGKGSKDHDKKVADLKKEEADQKKKLPTAEELVAFITGLSKQTGKLKLLSFDKGKPNEQDYYIEIPIKMKVEGTFKELISFMKQIAKKDARVVNLRGLKVKRRRIEVELEFAKLEDKRRAEMPEGVAPPALSVRRREWQLVKAYENAVGAAGAGSRKAPIQAEFTAYVFTYTGRPASTQAARKNKTAIEQRQQRRKKNLILL